MKRILMLAGMLFIPLLSAAAITGVLVEADALHDAEDYEAGFSLLENALPSADTDGQKAEIYWRLAKFQLAIADDLEDEGADAETLLSLYDRGSAFAEEAIALEPSADAYYWRSSNVGRWGETKGVLNSLFKAGPMKDDLLKVIEYDPDYADAWYVLGRLHLLLPGWPLSFGNIPFAVSFARRAVELYDGEDLKISYYKSLAETLWKREWDARKRNREIDRNESKYKGAGSEFDRQSYFESYLGTGFSPVYTSDTLSGMSDREEARIITEWLEDEYAKIPAPDRGDRRNIEEVREMTAQW
jgi:tetratricopeptide (TPR) repeat protein